MCITCAVQPIFQQAQTFQPDTNTLHMRLFSGNNVSSIAYDLTGIFVELQNQNLNTKIILGLKWWAWWLCENIKGYQSLVEFVAPLQEDADMCFEYTTYHSLENIRAPYTGAWREPEYQYGTRALAHKCTRASIWHTGIYGTLVH